MLDLGKPYGVHENIVFYGDHEQDNIVYYLPNEVSLAPVISDNTEDEKTFDFFLQIFKEGTAIKGGLKELEDSSGAIMSLGVQCTANEEKLERVRETLIDDHNLPDDFFFSLPEWKDGSVDLIVLDSTTQNQDTINDDSFVESIIGSKKPSLSSSDLKSIFNVRLDRKGASLIAATLQGERSSVAGILYNLQFKAMRCALDMTIKADLDRCHQKVSHGFAAGVGIKYGELGISAKAELEFIKEKLIEDGDIEINVLSQVTDADTKKMMNEMIEEFSDKVMRELFSPYISPEIPDIPGGIPNPTPGDGILIGAAYKFRKKKLFHNKTISIDYRQRSATTKIHNPQSHLWLLGNQIKDKIDLYSKTITFSNLWREHHLDIALLHDFDAPINDLLSAEVLIWRKKDGKTSELTNRFAIPENVDALASFTFTKDDKEKHAIAWITEADEPSGYFYQTKFTYKQDVENINSPVVVFSHVNYSSSQDLIIIPQVLAPLQRFEFRYGNIDTTKVKGVDIFIRSKDVTGTQINQEILSLSETNQKEVWNIRNQPNSQAYIEEERHYHFSDGRPTLQQGSTTLLDEEIIIADPFEFKRVQIIPVIIGADVQKHLEILLHLSYETTQDNFVFDKLLRAKAPDFTLDELHIPVLEKGDAIAYKFTAVTTNGDLEILQEGVTTGGPLLLKIEDKINENQLLLKWNGPSFESEEINYIRFEFKLEKEDGTTVQLKKEELSGNGIPAPIIYHHKEEGKLFVKITKRFEDGSKEKGKYTEVVTDEIVVTP